MSCSLMAVLCVFLSFIQPALAEEKKEVIVNKASEAKISVPKGDHSKKFWITNKYTKFAPIEDVVITSWNKGYTHITFKETHGFKGGLFSVENQLPAKTIERFNPFFILAAIYFLLLGVIQLLNKIKFSEWISLSLITFLVAFVATFIAGMNSYYAYSLYVTDASALTVVSAFTFSFCSALVSSAVLIDRRVKVLYFGFITMSLASISMWFI